jgi:hypothetical protein
MTEKQWFNRYGRYCPVDCAQACCIICEYSAGAIEFIPTRPAIACRHEDVEKHPEYKKGEGMNCPCFSKDTVPEHAIMAESKVDELLGEDQEQSGRCR